MLPWLPQAGLEVHFRMDGYAWLFAMLVIVDRRARCPLCTLLHVAARIRCRGSSRSCWRSWARCSASVLSGNLIQLVVFWELTSLTSFMLIGYWYHSADARRGARMALIVTVGGRLVSAARRADARRDRRQLRLGPSARQPATRSAPMPRYLPMLVLILLGVFTKSAQFPFHFWLPHAMAAPTPVSAYLHSATMVKAGVFLLARLWPALAGTDCGFGWSAARALRRCCSARICAMFQRDMKGVLAYSTISHLGLITLLLGMNSELAAVAAVFHMLNHATFKASLFMATGIIDHETGTRDLRRLSGLLPLHADHGDAGDGGSWRDGGRAAAERVPVERNVLRGIDRRGARTTGSGFTLPPYRDAAGASSASRTPLRFIHQVFFGPPAHGSAARSRTSRLAACDCAERAARRWRASWSAFCPARTMGPFLSEAALLRAGHGACPSTSWRCGTGSRPRWS